MISKRKTPTNPNYTEVNSHQVDQYYSVEFSLDDPMPLYQFKLRNSESMALFVLVKEDSEILNRLEVGRVLKMKYYNTDKNCPPEYRTTQINTIINDKEGRFSGHCMVELFILPAHQNHQISYS